MDEESTETSTPTRNAYLSVIIVLVLIVLLLAASMLFLLQRRSNVNALSAAPESKQTTRRASTSTAPTPAEPVEITSRTGKVIRASAHIVTFTAIAFDESTSGYAAREMEARITPATVITAITKSNTPPLPGQAVQAAGAEPINSASIRSGDTVEVIATENVKGKMRFDAAEIRRIIHQ